MVPIPQINFQYRPTTAELRGIAVRQALSRFWTKIGLSLFGAIAIRAYLYPTRTDHHRHPLNLTFAITFGIYVLWTLADIIVSYPSTGQNGGQDHGLVVEPDGVTLVSPGVREFISWESVKKIGAEGRGLVIQTAPGVSHIVPSSAFRGAADRDSFLHAANAVRNGFNVTAQNDGPAWPPPPGSVQ